VVRLTAASAVTRQAVSKHLRALEDAGLVASGRSGRERVWELRPRRLQQIRRCLDAISAQWGEAIERLRTLVEEG
jgi:DNA-binding transcriptional ArsR family regulator